MMLHGWQWAIFAAELLALVFGLDWFRRDLKYGDRKREWQRRVEARSTDVWRDLPPHQRVDYLAALVCARDNGDLLTEEYSRRASAEILRFPRPR